MGTSSTSNGTSGNGTPLVPSWLEDGNPSISEGSPDLKDDNPQSPNNEDQPIPQPGDPKRYTLPRSNFTRFVSSGGNNKGSLKRALSGYVSHSAGGAKQATKRMGASRKVASDLLSFLSNASNQGVEKTLESLNLKELSGLPIERVFTEVMNKICPPGGRVDENIARDAFTYMISELADNEITNFDDMNDEQMSIALELFITHSIEDQLYNEIGINVIKMAPTHQDSQNIENIMHDFISNAVSDALHNTEKNLNSVSQKEISSFIDNIYTQAFSILEALADEDKK